MHNVSLIQREFQEVFRSLMAPEEVRGKKYYQQYMPNADNQYISEW